MPCKRLPHPSAPTRSRIATDTVGSKTVIYERVRADAFDAYHVYFDSRWLGMLQYIGCQWCMICNSPVFDEVYGITRRDTVKTLLIAEGVL